jgi:hypothetical protein
MVRRALRLTNLPVTVLGLALAGLGGAALILGNSDAVVERGFQRALAEMTADQTTARKSTTVAGSEDFWLTHVVHKNAPLTAKPVSIGDSVTISSGGRERVFRVVDIDELDSKIIPISSSSSRLARLLLVTCRDEADPNGRPVRLVIEADDSSPALSPVSKRARAL